LKTSAVAVGALISPATLMAAGTEPLNPREKLFPTEKVSFEFLGLSRTTFGVRPQDLEALRILGKSNHKAWESHLERQLHPDQIKDQALDEKLNKLSLGTLNKSLEQLWKDHVVAADELKAMPKEVGPPLSPPADKDANKNAKKDENKLRLEPARDTEIATWMKAVYSERQLQEVLAGFWHDHFSVFAWDQKVAPVFVHYDRDVIRRHMLGNFREFLEAVATSPAMLHYLDNELNQSGNPNENYARELFELHTLGAENYLGTTDRKKVPGYASGHPAGYVDGDVYEAARAFTGWRVDQGQKSGNTGRFDYFDSWHDRFQKVVLGRPLKEYQPPLKDGHDVLDLLANHPGTARFLSRKLCRRFVSDTPSEGLVQATAKVFTAHAKDKDQLKRVVQFILLSEEFANSWGQKFKRPFEYVAGLLRMGEAGFSASEDFLRNFERTGQKLWGWRTPDGAPDSHEKWASPNTLIERWRLTNQIVCEQFGAFPLKAGPDIFTTWEKRIFNRPISGKTREQVLAFLTDHPNENQTRMGVALLFMSPENQWR